jgi:6-phosphogluconolactonase
MSQIKKLLLTFSLLTLTVLQPFAGAAQNSPANASGECFVYVGTYTKGGSKGIYLYRMDMASGALTSEGLVAELPNPTFFDLDSHGKFLYAATETSRYSDSSGDYASGGVSAYSVDAATGKLTFLNSRSSGGDGPCHILLDKANRDALIANYGGGSVEVLPISADGQLGKATSFIQDEGKSINADRQEKPHAHSMALDAANHFAFACDLGTDRIMVYRFDAEHGKLTPNNPPFAAIKPGSGPRHMTFSADNRFAYLVNELTSTVNVFAYDARRGELRELQTISALPENFKGQNTGAEIALHPSGKFLYTSNRGDNSIAVFAVDGAKGTLAFLQRQSVEGKTPRYFAIDPSGKFLIDANQDSNNLVLFTVNPETGQLTSTGKSWEIAAPVCVKFLPIAAK